MKCAPLVCLFAFVTLLLPQGATFAQGRHRTSRPSTSYAAASSGLVLNFAPAVNYESGGYEADSVVVTDVNGDGKPDLVVANYCVLANSCDTNGTVGVLLGNGDGTFQAAVTYSSGGYGAESVAVADVNGDGNPDVVVVSDCPTYPCPLQNIPNGTVGVLLGNGDGTFRAAVTYDSGGSTAHAVAVLDLNGDGKLDIVVANECPNNVDCTNGLGSPGTMGVLLGNGDGTFQAAVTYDSGGTLAWAVVVVDVNGDGKPDILVANCNSGCGGSNQNGTVGVLLGNGDGTFQAAISYDAGGVWARSLAVADLNGDGKPDIVVTNNFPGLGVLLGNGDGTFQTAVTYNSGGFLANSVAVADVNEDSKPDIVVANFCADQNNCGDAIADIVLGNGDGTFQAALSYDAGGEDFGLGPNIAVADLNGDGKPDIVVANNCVGTGCNGALGVLISTGGYATTTGFASSPNPSTFGQAVTFTATVTHQGAGTPTGTVSFFDGTTNLGSSSLNGTGVATLTTSALMAATHNVSAVYNGDANFAPSTSPMLQQNVQDFSLSANPTTVTISAPGQGASTTITITTQGSLSAQTLTGWKCSGLPTGGSCMFGIVDSSNQMNVSFTTTASSDLRWPLFGHDQRLIYAMWLPAFLAVFVTVRRRGTWPGLRLLAMLAVLGVTMLSPGCSNNNSSSNSGTPKGTSTVTVSATAGSLSHSVTITLTVD